MFVDLMKGGLKHGEGGVEILGAARNTPSGQAMFTLVLGGS